MMLNHSLLDDVEKLFCEFFEKYHECSKYAYISSYSLTQAFYDLRRRFALHDSDGLITDAQRQAYFEWEHDYLKELNQFAKTHGSSVSYKSFGKGYDSISVGYKFSIPRDELMKKCLGNAAQFASSSMTANKHSFLEFMVRYGINALDGDTLRELKATFTNAINYLESDILPKAKKFRESFFDVEAKVKGYDSEAWVSCAKTLKPLYYEAYQVAYATYEKLLEVNPDDSYAKRLSNIEEFHNFDEFYDEMVKGRNSNSLISVQLIRINCEKCIQEFLEQH